MIRHFVTVDFCKEGRRGIFCDQAGHASSSDKPWTQLEILKILGPFWIILDPKSVPLTEEEVAEYNQFTPLAEYSYAWGVARKLKDTPLRDVK